MEEKNLGAPSLKARLVGRDAELSTLKQHLDGAVSGQGSTVLISGEPGIGKTALVEAFKEHAATQNVKILSGAASADSAQPFLVFSKALAGEMGAPLFEEQEYAQFVKIFAINQAGMLVAETSSVEENMGSDIFAEMLSAVQNFVGDSFNSAKEQNTGLGRLEYGDMKILIEHGKHLFLTGVFSGGEHPDMRGALKRALQKLEEEHGEALEKWPGNVSDVVSVQERIEGLAEIRFLVRRDLEGVKLENERLRIADKVLDSLKDLCSRGPMTLILEDMHWTDESSVWVLSYIARNITESSALVVAVGRTGENRHFDGSLSSMKGEGSILEIELRGLSEGMVADLASSVFSPNSFSSTFLGRLANGCNGNPLFVIEMLREMEADGAISLHEGAYILLDENISIPSSLGDVVRMRLDGLGTEAFAMAEYASCVGTSIPREMSKGIGSISDIEGAVEELVTKGILRETKDGFVFASGFFMETIYDGMAPRWKVAHHRCLAEMYEKIYAGREDEAIFELARHFSNAKVGGKAAEYSMRAALKAAAAMAPEQVVEHCRMGLVNLSLSGDEERNAASRLSFRQMLGDSLLQMGDAQGALSEYDSALRESDEGLERARIQVKRVKVFERTRDLGGALAAIDEGEREAPVGSPERMSLELGRASVLNAQANYDGAIGILSKLISQLSGRIDRAKLLADAYTMMGKAYSHKGDLDKSYENDSLALEIREKLGDDYGIAILLNNMAITHYMKGDQDGAATRFEGSIRIRERIKDRYGLAVALNNLGGIYFARGEWTRTLELTHQSLAIKRKIGDRSGIAKSLDIIGLVKMERGELTEALSSFLESLSIRESLNDKHGISDSFNYIGNAHLLIGEVDKAEEAHRSCLAMREELGDQSGITATFNNLGGVSLEKGDFGRSEDFFMKAKSLAEKNGEKEFIADAAINLAHLYIRTRDFGRAGAILEDAVIAVRESGIEMRLPKLRMLEGMLFARTCKHIESRMSFEAALSGFEAIKSMGEAATTQYEWAITLPKDDPERRLLLQKALARFESGGMRGMAERCRKALNELER